MLDDKPGCYGSPLCCRGGAVCAVCPLAVACKTAADERSTRLRAKFGISVSDLHGSTVRVLARRAKVQAAEPAEGLTNKKAIEMVTRIKSRGIDVKGAIEKGRNPFVNQTPAFMRVASDLLLREGWIDRAELRRAMVEQLNWSAASAASHAGIAVGVFEAFGVNTQKQVALAA